MTQQNTSSHKRNLRDAERAMDRAFSTGKADQAAITRQAQLDAAEAVAMAGIAMESDAEVDEAARLTVITASMGDRKKAKEARDREREARNKAKADHAAATKSAKKAYDAIKFSNPNRLGFMRFVQVSFVLHIVATLLVLILTSRDTVVYSAVNISEWFMVVLEAVAFYFFVNRFKIGRPLVIVIAALGLVHAIVTKFLYQGNITLDLFTNIGYFLFMLLYFIFSDRVKMVLVNDLSSYRESEDEDTLVIDRKSWPFYRNLIIYFVVFSVLGHWMEAGMCQFIRLGLVQGEYDPSNTMLWRDWLYPYPMEGAAVVLIALILYPLFVKMRSSFKNRFLPYIVSFVLNALTCTAIELVGGLLFNAQHQNWDYSDLPFNFMGQVCLQNAVAFGVAASVIAWWVYPALERFIARMRPAIMNIVCVVVAVAGGILFSLYAISPPEGIDLGGNSPEIAQAQVDEDYMRLTTVLNILSKDADLAQERLNESETLTVGERAKLQQDVNALNRQIAELERDIKSSVKRDSGSLAEEDAKPAA